METLARNALALFRGSLFGLYLRMHGCQVGKKLRCLGWPVMRCVPKGNIRIGHHVSLGKGVVLEITETGSLQLDDHALIGDYCTLSSAHSISMHKWSGIAERVSIRDNFHGMHADELYRLQASSGSPVVLEEDTGVGAGAVLLQGARLPKGAFVGANAVITVHTPLEPYGIYAGNPAKLVKSRMETQPQSRIF